MTETVRDRFLGIRARIEKACARSGRDPQQIVLVGACKRQPAERLLAAHDAGLRAFGENIVQEALSHRDLLPADVEWHLIGPLQSNKAKRAARLFTWVHSVDRPKIARILDRVGAEAGANIHGLLEINLGREPSKHGFAPDALEHQVEEMASFEHLRIEGLMAIPPSEPDPESSRHWFRRLRELRDRLFSDPRWSDRPGFLSMGMSNDYAVAIEEGATHVRIGTALFGPREARKPG